MADPARSAPEGVDFDKTIEEALDSLPPDLREFMSNVAIVVEEEPPPGAPVAGALPGVPLTTRGRGLRGVPGQDHDLPTSTGASLRRRSSPAGRREIRRVVLHEVAHHFGISDERLVEIGRY